MMTATNHGGTHPEAQAPDGTDLTGAALAEQLWSTLRDLRAGIIQPDVADSIACQAREITRIVRTRALILGQAREALPADLVGFARGR